jgi:hypothetical protein
MVTVAGMSREESRSRLVRNVGGDAECREVVEDAARQRRADDLGRVQLVHPGLELGPVRVRVAFGDQVHAGDPERLLLHEVRAGLDLPDVGDGVLAPGRAVLLQQPPVLPQRVPYGVRDRLIAHPRASPLLDHIWITCRGVSAWRR